MSPTLADYANAVKLKLAAFSRHLAGEKAILALIQHGFKEQLSLLFARRP